MKKSLFLALLCILPLILMANLETNVPVEMIQPDGTTLQLLASGDEFSNRAHDANGYTILRNPKTGWMVYAVAEGNGYKPSDYVVGKVDPASLGITPGLKEDPEAVRARITSAHREAPPMRERTSTTGQINNIVVFVRFADQSEYTHAKTYNSYSLDFNNDTVGANSMVNFYTEVSNSTLNIDTVLYPPASGGFVVSYQSTHNRDYYNPYNATTNPIGYNSTAESQTRERELIAAIAAHVEANNYVPDALDIDNDNDGSIDNMCFILQGSNTGWSTTSLLWPHWWTLPSSYNARINGILVNSYNVQIQNSFNPSVCCHEMGHSLGFPDLYHYYTLTNIDPMGAWDVMCANTSPPQHFNVYSMYKYGHWCSEPLPIAGPGVYTLTPVSQSPYNAFKIASNTAGQFYIVEYRKKEGYFESSIPASGMIVYRVDTSRNGNAYPPDEIWLYRPGSNNNTTNGTPDTGYYSLESGRTAIHSYTTPMPYLQNNADGGLKITDVSSAGNTISFRLWDVLPKIWRGTTSTDWNTAGNWQNGIPTSADNVSIPGGCVRYPHVISTASCKSMTMDSGTSLTIEGAALTVNGDLNIRGQLAMNNSGGSLYVTGHFYWESGSTAYITANGFISVQGNMEFLPGSTVQMAYGTIEFYGNGISYLRVYEATEINNLSSYKNAGFSTRVSSLSTQDLFLHGSFYNYSGKTFYYEAYQTMHVAGNFTNYAGGFCYMLSGAIIFEGASNQYVTNAQIDGCFFNDLQIAITGGYKLWLNSSIRINGDLNITAGGLRTNDNDIYLGGDWNNELGTDAFLEGTGEVQLIGTNTQTISSEDFYTLNLNKPSGEMLVPFTSQISCSIYDWTSGAYRVDGGWFVAADLADSGIMGTITLDSGNIEYTQDAGQYIDLRGNLTIHSGNFNIIGGYGPAYFAYVDAATLTMDSGVLDFKNAGIYIPTSPVFTENISGGRIRTPLGFQNYRSDFTPTGGVLELYGTADCYLENTAGSNLYSVEINKGVLRTDGNIIDNAVYYDRRHQPIQNERTNGVIGVGPLDINGYFTLSGGTFTAPAIMQVAGNWTNSVGPAAFIEGTGSVEFNGTAHQYCSYSEDFYTLWINKVAAFRLNTAGETVTCVNYTWNAGAVDVLNGTFIAGDMTQNGYYGNFYVNPGGVINLTQDSGSWPDLNANLYNYGGTINLYGGSLDSYLAYSANAGITMTSGVIDFKTRGIYIYSSIYSLTMNVTGGTIRTVGSWQDTRGNVPLAYGTVELYGANNVGIQMGTGSYFYNLTVNKTTAREGAAGRNAAVRQVPSKPGIVQIIDERFEGAYAINNLLIRGNLLINAGIFDVNGSTVETYQDIQVHSSIKMITAGFLNCGDDFIWYSGSSSNITAGSIRCGWDWRFDSGSAVQLTGCTTTLAADYDANITTASANSWFGSLILDGNVGGEGSTYFISVGSTQALIMHGSLTIYGDNVLDLTQHNATVDNNVAVAVNGGIIIGDGGTFTMNSDFSNNGTLNIGAGSAIVHGVYTSYDTASLLIAGGSLVNDVVWAARTDSGELAAYSQTPDRSTVELRGAIHLEGGLLEITNNSVIMKAHADRIFSNGILRVGVGFTAVEANAFLQEGGELELTGNSNTTLNVSGGNYVYALHLHKSGSYFAYLQANILVKNNVYIQSGGIVTNNYGITLYGYWNNPSGAAAFVEGTGTVTFAGNSTETGIQSNETFYNLVINNTATNYNNFKVLATKTLGVTYNLTVTDGTINMQDNTSLNVGNDIVLAAGAGINAYNGLLVNVAVGRNWTDNNVSYSSSAGYYPGSSTFTFNGTAVATVTVAGTAFDVVYLVINKTSGGEVHFSKPVRVYGNGTITAGTWADTVVGLTHEFRGNFTIAAAGLWYVNNQNIIAFKGTTDQTFTNSGSGSIYSLTVDKTVGTSLLLGSTILGLNGGNIIVNAGILDLNHNLYRTTGSITINNSGKLSVDTNATLEVANTKVLTVNSGGTLELIGTAGNLAKLTHQSGNYTCSVESGGTLSAEYATFEYMGSSGINVKTGALVDVAHPLNYCTFQNGIAAGTLLTINNSQTLTISGAAFPANSWSGTYNVAKTANQGTVNFTSPTGTFAGATYENDAYARINWPAAALPDLSITAFSYASTNPYICDGVNVTVTVLNTGTVDITIPFRVDLYYNRATPPPAGTLGDLTHTFTTLAHGATASWTFPNVSTITAGTWSSYVQADPSQVITESNEANNAPATVSVTWRALPAVSGLTITKLSPTQMRLNWTYPLSVYRYKVYRDTDPNGAFTTVVGTPTTNVFTDTVASTNTKYFYKVRAERNLP